MEHGEVAVKKNGPVVWGQVRGVGVLFEEVVGDEGGGEVALAGGVLAGEVGDVGVEDATDRVVSRSRSCPYRCCRP